MHNHIAYILTLFFLLLASVPWLISSCASQPLMPEDLVLERLHYEQTVEASQDATIEAQRQLPSTHNVIPIGTVAVTAESELAATTPENHTPQAVPAEEATAALTSTEVSERNETEPSTVNVVSTQVLTQNVEPTPVQIIVSSGLTVTDTTEAGSSVAEVEKSQILTETSIVTQTQVLTAATMEVQDVLTEQMITDQILQDTGDLGISDMVVRLTPDGVAGFGNVATLFGRQQQVETLGQFVIKNESLKINITSILIGGRDVTDQYGGQLEESIDASLYRLLPQRYVQLYELGFGEVEVLSEIK